MYIPFKEAFFFFYGTPEIILFSFVCIAYGAVSLSVIIVSWLWLVIHFYCLVVFYFVGCIFILAICRSTLDSG